MHPQFVFARCRQLLGDSRVFAMSPNSKMTHKQYGPAFVRNVIIDIDKLAVDDPATGWRDPSEERVEQLFQTFSEGGFGMSVTCGVQVLLLETADGKTIIDDGVSTVKALLRCRRECPEETWSAHLADVMKSGLHCKVVKYTDDEDKESRELWNVAKHDEDNNTVRWSSLYQKLNIVKQSFRRSGDWQKTTQMLVDAYGPGKRSTIGRWVRAARGIEQELFESLKQFPDLRDSYFLDNPHLVSTGTRSRNQLAPKFALMALERLRETQQEGQERNLTAPSFTNTVCRPLKAIELWHHLMSKRYGSVSINSPAMARLMQHLGSWRGLPLVSACITSNVDLHDANGGIPECCALVAEFDKCKAGGLPPPVRVPTEAERKAEEDRLRQEREAKLKEEADARAAAEAARRQADEEAELACMVDEADLMALSTGGIEAPPTAAAEPAIRDPAAVADDEVKAELQRVHFCNTTDSLAAKVQEMGDAGRLCIVVEAPTTTLGGFAKLIDDVAKMLVGLLEASTVSNKVRCVVLVNRRHDLIFKAQEKFKTILPSWDSVTIQVQSKERQSAGSPPMAGPSPGLRWCSDRRASCRRRN